MDMDMELAYTQEHILYDLVNMYEYKEIWHSPIKLYNDSIHLIFRAAKALGKKDKATFGTWPT